MNAEKESCIWSQNLDGIWNTECNNSFVLDSGSPFDNKMHYCCYCGSDLLQEEYKENDH